tara:strand:- start:350 stop:709 length:360 start_codon:yes stop_codon:yes gene_type:complete
MTTIARHKHEFSRSEWPFSDSANVVVISTVQVFRQGFPILRVSHDYDGDWQILCGTTLDTKDAIVACLGCAYQRDKTIGELADMPRGVTLWADLGSVNRNHERMRMANNKRCRFSTDMP